MVSALGYLVNRFFARLIDFFDHWYKDGFVLFSREFVNFLESLDRYFAFRVTLRYLFKPLYQNYTFIGYILGFIFRGARLIGASFVYLLVILTGLILYLIWISIPVVIIYKIFA
jgi:hypothetical protein